MHCIAFFTVGRLLCLFDAPFPRLPLIGRFSKFTTATERERYQTKGLTSTTIVLHLRLESLPSSAKQEREMTKLYVYLENASRSG